MSEPQGLGGPTRGAIWSVLSALSFSTAAVVGKDLLNNLGIFSLLFWRFAIGSVVLGGGVTLWHRRGGPDLLAIPKRRALAVGVLYGVMVTTGFFAIRELDVSVYIVLVYVYPVLVMVASSLLGHRVSPMMWVALAIVMAGIALTVPELFGGGVGHISTLGLVLTVTQSFMMAAYMIIGSRALPHGTDGVVTATWMVFGAFLASVPMVLIGGLAAPRSASVIGEILLFALIPTVCSNVCFFFALRHLVPAVVAMLMTLEVAFAILWSVTFLGETMRPVKILGAAVVVAGVLVAQGVALRSARAERSGAGGVDDTDAALKSPLAV